MKAFTETQQATITDMITRAVLRSPTQDEIEKVCRLLLRLPRDGRERKAFILARSLVLQGRAMVRLYRNSELQFKAI